MANATAKTATHRDEAAADLLERAEQIRTETSKTIPAGERSSLGQYTTPAGIASFMASLFEMRFRHRASLLDPGAGTGSLTAAFVARQLRQTRRPKELVVTAYEFDERMVAGLRETLEACQEACSNCNVSFAYDLRHTDYIRERAGGCDSLWSEPASSFDYVLMNPPYRKINSKSETRHLLRLAGVETSNLYSAFMLLGTEQLSDQGEFVSITPRSFCNGAYFRRFRQSLTDRLSITRLHVFESRTDNFREDSVLQENIILHGMRSSSQRKSVTISASTSNGEPTSRCVATEKVLRPDDPEKVIHVITDDRDEDTSARMLRFRHSLDDLHLNVSTGRVVDFRATNHLRNTLIAGTVPLIYPGHLKFGYVQWPDGQERKPNAIVANKCTYHLLVPSGFYVLVKRFSAKEERRRIVASVFDPRDISSKKVGFDNKTNYIHAGGEGLTEHQARGMTIFLNSSLVDRYFRLFSGHTQVNAADLRRLPYPSRSQLDYLSAACSDLSDPAAVDSTVKALLNSG